MAKNYFVNPREQAKKYIEEQMAKSKSTEPAHPLTKEEAVAKLDRELSSSFGAKDISQPGRTNRVPVSLGLIGDKIKNTPQAKTAINKKDWEKQFRSPETQELIARAENDMMVPGHTSGLFKKSLATYTANALKDAGRNILNAIGDAVIQQNKYGEYSANDPALVFAKENGMLDGYSFDKYNDIINEQEKGFAANVKKSAEKSAAEQRVAEERARLLPSWQKTAAKYIGQTANMLPSVASGVVFGPTAGTSVLFTQAYGGGVQEALSEGASIDEARTYDLMSAALEVAVEKVAGSIPGLGKGVIGKVVEKFLKDGATRNIVGFIFDTAGEGGEEVATAFLTPYLKRAIYNPEAKPPTAEEYREAFLGGVTGSLLLGGGQKVLQTTANIASRSHAYTEPQEPRITLDDIIKYKPRDASSAQQEASPSAGIEPIQVGRVTKIYRPYQGAVPTQDNFSGERQIIPDEFLKNAKKTITAATNTETKKVDRSWIRRTFQQIFDAQGGQKQVPVQGVTMDGELYIVSVGRKVVGKVVSDANLTAEKLAILEDVENVIANAEYVGSGEYEQKSTKEKNVTRYDYFETPVFVNGKDYIASFDVEVYPNTNNYRTHKVINEMDLIPVSTADVGPVPTAAEMVSSPSSSSIPQNAEKSNRELNAKLTIQDGEVTTPQSNPGFDSSPRVPQRVYTGEPFAEPAEGSDTSSTASGPSSTQEEGIRRSKLGSAKAVADILSSAYGVKFAEYSAEDGLNGYYDPETRTIYVNQESDEPVLATISHELLHDLKVNDPGAFYTLRQIVNQDMNLTSFEAYKKSLLAAYDAIGKDYSGMTETELYEHVLEEAMADLCAEVMRDPNAITRIAEADRNLAQRIIGKLSEILETIRKAFQEYFGGETAEIRSLVNNFTEVKSVYQSVLENTAKKGSMSEGIRGEIKYNVKMDFKHQVDDALDGKLKRGYSVYVGNTPNLLHKCGLDENLPMLMHQGHLRNMNSPKSEDNIHFHGLSRDIIKQIPEQLKHPVMIYDSISPEGKENTVCVLTSLLDEDGLPVIIAVKANSEGGNKYFDVSFETKKTDKSNFVASAYGRNGFKYHIEDILNQNAILYANKNKTLKLFSDIGLQLPERLNNLGFDTIIHQSNNIVNTSIRAEKKNDTSFDKPMSVSRKVRAEDAIAKYKESGDERNLPDRSWTRGFVRDAQNRSRYLENQLQDLEYQLAFADDASRGVIEGSISKLREKIQEAAKSREVAIELNDVLDNTTLNRNIDLAPVIGDLNDVDTGLKLKNGNYRFNEFYRNMERFFGRHFHLVKPLVDGFDSAKGDFARMQVERLSDMKQYIVNELGIKPGSDESKAVQWIGEGKRNPFTKEEIQQIDAIVREQASAKKLSKKQTSELKKTLRVDYTEEMLRREFGDEAAERILKAEQWFRKQYDELIDEINRTQRLIYPNRPDKQIPRRKDYMRHFRELNTGFRGLTNIFGVDNNIAPELVLVSDHTKPKEKWASIKQEREGGATDEGAVEGFLDYLPQAAYAIHLNPYIDKFRGLARDIADLKAETGDTSANGFIKYLNDFASHIAGKSDALDRVILDKLGSNGRTLIKTLNWFNNRVKSNAVLGNVGSVTKQVMNIPNGMELLHNPAGILQGIGDVITGGKDVRENYKKSDFLTERFLDSSYSQFEKNGLKKGAQWLLSAADEFGTRAIWNAAYREGVRLSEAGEITETPERYADILTRRAVAGRGVGEVPLAYQSQVGKLVMPFQIEVSNTWNVHRDVLSGKAQSWGKESTGLEKGARELIGYLAVWGLGAALEALTGSKGAFDPLGAILDGILQGKEEEKEGSTWDKILKMGQRSLQNVGGEFIGSRPMGWVLGEFLTLFDEDWATNLFNDSVFQSQGVNIPAVQSLSKSAKDFKDGDIVGGLAEFGSSFLTPFGGKQLDKMVRGTADFVHGGKYQNDFYEELSTGERGDKRYDIPRTGGNFAKSFLFGPSSLSVGQEYWDAKRQEGYAQTAKSSATSKAMKQFAKGYDKEHPDSEVERLYREVKDFSVYPHGVLSDVQKFTKDNKEIIFSLLPAEKEQYQKEQDRRMQLAYDEVIRSQAYQTADTEGKVELLEDARVEARKTVSDMILNDHLYKDNRPYGRLLAEGEHQKRIKKDSGTPDGLAAHSKASALVSFATAAEKDGRMTQAGAKKLQAVLSEKQTVTDLDRELYRLHELGTEVDVMSSAYKLFSFEKNKKDYRIKVSGDALADIYTDTEARIRKAMERTIATSQYQNASVKDKKDMLAIAKSDVRADIREELKAKYGYGLDDEFAKMARMK